MLLVASVGWMLVGSRAWAVRTIDWAAAIVSLVICAYITVCYEALTHEIALMPLEGIIGGVI
jgi:hypothetical protein